MTAYNREANFGPSDTDNWGENDLNEHQANDPVIDWSAYHTEKLSLPKNKQDLA